MLQPKDTVTAAQSVLIPCEQLPELLLHQFNSSSGSTFLEELTKANGDVLEARERNPYQPVVYAIPEEWHLAEKALLEQAVQFQPSIYQALQILATGQELEQMQTALIQIFRAEKLETLHSIRTTLEQAGNESDKHLSEWSMAQFEKLAEVKENISAAEKKITKLIFAVMAGTGLRVEEVAGLWWCDIDLEEGIIDVNHTLVYYDHRDPGSKRGCYFNVHTPKTEQVEQTGL